MNELIYDANHLKEFINILPDLGDLDVYFVSLSCRNKYLTEEERAIYELGRTEMFGQQIARSKDKLYRNIRRYESHPEAYTTKNGSVIPNKAMVCYLNIDTSSSLKAYKEFSGKINENMIELAHKAMLGQSIKETAKYLNKLDKTLMDCYQRAAETKKFIDIDFDIPKDKFGIVQGFLNEMKSHGVTCYVIDTHGGWHVLIDREFLKFNYNKSVEAANIIAKEILGDAKFEIVVNNNRMVPVPGTLQAGHPVKFWKFE